MTAARTTKSGNVGPVAFAAIVALILVSPPSAVAGSADTMVDVEAPNESPAGLPLAVSGSVTFGPDVFVAAESDLSLPHAQALWADIERAIIMSDPAAPSELVFAIELASVPPVLGAVPEVVAFNWNIIVDGEPPGGRESGGFHWRRTNLSGGDTSTDPFVALRSCSLAGCSYDRLEGAFEVDDARVTARVPLAAIGGRLGSELEAGFEPGQGPSIWSGVYWEMEGRWTYAQVDVAGPQEKYVVPTPAVELAIVPAGAPDPPNYPLVVMAKDTVPGAPFSGEFSTAGLTPGSYEVVARACWGSNCGTSRAPVSLT